MNPQILKQQGFSLIELLVVLILMGVLLLLAIPAFTGQEEKARETNIVVQMRTVLNTAMTTRIQEKYNTYPPANQLRNDILKYEPNLPLRLPPGSVEGAIYVISPESLSSDFLQFEGYSLSGKAYCLSKNWNEAEVFKKEACSP